MADIRRWAILAGSLVLSAAGVGYVIKDYKDQVDALNRLPLDKKVERVAQGKAQIEIGHTIISPSRPDDIKRALANKTAILVPPVN